MWFYHSKEQLKQQKQPSVGNKALKRSQGQSLHWWPSIMMTTSRTYIQGFEYEPSFKIFNFLLIFIMDLIWMNLLQGPSLGKNISMYLVNEEKFKTFKVFLKRSPLYWMDRCNEPFHFWSLWCEAWRQEEEKKFNLLQKFIIWIAKAYLKRKWK